MIKNVVFNIIEKTNTVTKTVTYALFYRYQKDYKKGKDTYIKKYWLKSTLKYNN